VRSFSRGFSAKVVERERDLFDNNNIPENLPHLELHSIRKWYFRFSK